MSHFNALPIAEVWPRLRAALGASPLTLLQAPPGAGKSTALPLALLQEPYLAGQRILLLQPRRVAARAVAARLAAQLGERVGETVGLRVRFETQVSARTRLEVVTEGIVVRRLQRDPELLGVGLIVFDEFHERSLNADLALALVREVQAALRPDLKVLVMSATLDPHLPAQLPGAPSIESQGRAYPIELVYLSADPPDPVAAVPSAVTRALDQHSGDVLVFLPGVAEIRRTQRQLRERLAQLAGPAPEVLPLYGDLPLADQQRAVLPAAPGVRRVILATNIAETSLTLAGVRVVIDSGLTRHQHFDPASGLSRLMTSRVTRSSAAQRAGRAGRTAPGTAYRLWSERTQALLSESALPEILSADLAPLALEVAGWGAAVSSLPWLEAPPAPRLELAQALLRDLGALSSVQGQSQITPVGRELLELPTHPRLAHLLRGAAQQGLGGLAADLAALLEERDPLGREAGSDMTERVDALQRFRRFGAPQAHRGVLERAERLSAQWRRLLGVPAADRVSGPEVGRLLLLAYPERAAQLRPGSRTRYLLSGGQGGALEDGDPLASEPYLCVAALDPSQAEGRLYLAAPLQLSVLAAQAQTRDVVHWDARAGALSAQRQQVYGKLVLSSQPLTPLPLELRLNALRHALQQEGLGALPWNDDIRQWQARVLSLRSWRGETWPDVSDAALLSRLDEWLAPHLGEVRRRDDLAKVGLLSALQTLLPWPLPRELDELAPTHLEVPSGHRIRLAYRSGGEAPILAVKLQELFGLADTPTVNAGRTSTLLHLLSPARRPVQITQDLRSFWANGYFEVRKDLRGQYPKHPWPDDPWSATPTRATKKRMGEAL